MNVVMISFAASDVNISVVVEEADAEKAVHGLHREFFSDAVPARRGIGRAKTMYKAPKKQGLYDPRHEHDACGMGFVVDAHGTQVARDRQPGASRCC